MKSLLLLAPCILLTACVYSQNTSQHSHGTQVNQQQVALIETGKTDKQWVLANLGIPDRTQADKDGFEVFEYITENTEKTEKNLIFVFNIESEKELKKKVTRVVMRNAIVQSVTASEI